MSSEWDYKSDPRFPYSSLTLGLRRVFCSKVEGVVVSPHDAPCLWIWVSQVPTGVTGRRKWKSQIPMARGRDHELHCVSWSVSRGHTVDNSLNSMPFVYKYLLYLNHISSSHYCYSLVISTPARVALRMLLVLVSKQLNI